MSSDEDAAAVGKDEEHMEIDVLDSLADNVGTRTSAAGVAVVAGHTYFAHVDHEIVVKLRMLESWIAACDRLVDKGAACVRLLP